MQKYFVSFNVLMFYILFSEWIFPKLVSCDFFLIYFLALYRTDNLKPTMQKSSVPHTLIYTSYFSY